MLDTSIALHERMQRGFRLWMRFDLGLTAVLYLLLAAHVLQLVDQHVTGEHTAKVGQCWWCHTTDAGAASWASVSTYTTRGHGRIGVRA